MTAHDAGSLTPDSPLTELRGVGPVRAEALAAAGFSTVRDLAYHLPFRYEDRRRVSRLGAITAAGRYCLVGRFRAISQIQVRRRRLSMVRARLVTDDGELAVVWFNRPYVKSQIDVEADYLVHGTVRSRGAGWELVNPSIEPRHRARLAGRVVPVYSAVGAISPSLVRTLVTDLVERFDFSLMEDDLPARLRRKHGLPSLATALRQLNQPSAEVDVEALNAFQTPAQQRLAYAEALRIQVRLQLARQRVVREPKRHRYLAMNETARRLSESLPFALTAAQRRVVGEIFEDLSSPFPMMRLVQGDVGCGKTVVAALALAAAAESGLQGAIMAPTELLAEQHYRALRKLLGESISMALLTGSAENAGEVRDLLGAGKVSLAVGTHALIQKGVGFENLGLVIIDEQHRFGVAQRRELQFKGRRPDLLVMTATPIPRSLTLTLYGDLALSAIDELPPGRSPVATRVVPSSRRAEVYAELESRLEAGERAYIVLPHIEESSSLEVESIEGLGQELAGRLRRFHPATLHGRSSPEVRAEVMESFATGTIRVLIATTLIEVGVDVPEATIMVIESAERLGLSQLHQLRGRVGRGSMPSSCVAIHGRVSDQSRQRLEVFAATSDGFRIAEADLEIRGPGDLLGTRQSGLPAFRILDLVRDRVWIERARRDAIEIVEDRPQEAAGLASGPTGVAAYDRLAGA